LLPIPENGFTNREELQTWFDALPEDVSRPIAASLAIRAANRAVPFLHLIMSRDERFSNGQILLGELRPNFVSRVGQKWPKAQIIQATLASSQFVSNSLAKVLDELEEEKTNSKSQSEKLTISQSQLVLHQFGVAAHLAASVVSDVRMNTFVALTSIQFSCALLTLDAWNEVTYDVNKIAAGITPISLLDEPLVVSPPPTIWIATRTAFKAHLASLGPDWLIWKDWYDSVVDGKPAFNLPPDLAKDLSLRIALGGNTETYNKAFWDRDPEAINAEISGWLKEARATVAPEIPAEKDGQIWGVNPDSELLEPISKTSLQSDAEISDMESQRPYLLKCAQGLVNEIKLSLSNSTSQLLPRASDYLDAINKQSSDISIPEVYAAGTRLRNAHDRLRHEIEFEGMPVVAGNIGEAMDSVIALHGPFILSTQRGQELAKRARDDSRTKQQELDYKKKALEFSDALQKSKKLVSPKGKVQVAETNNEIATGPHPERSTQIAEYSNHNLLVTTATLISGEIVRAVLAGTTLGQAVIGTGSMFVNVAAAWLLANAPLLISLAATSPEVLGWLPHYLRWLKIKLDQLR
jgi:hypothetical protein